MITKLLQELKERILETRKIPVEILCQDVLFMTLGVPHSNKIKIKNKDNISSEYQNFMNALAHEFKSDILSHLNILKVQKRLEYHFEKYSRYQDIFISLITGKSLRKLGIIVNSNEIPKDTLESLLTRVFKTTTTERTLLNWFSTGKLVYIKNELLSQSTISKYEVISVNDKKEVFNVREPPNIGFGNFTWTRLSHNFLDVTSVEKFGWYLALIPHLIKVETSVLELSNKFNIITRHCDLVVKNNKYESGGICRLNVDMSLNDILKRSANRRMIIHDGKIQAGWSKTKQVATQEFVKNLSVLVDSALVRPFPITDTSTIIVTFGPEITSDHAFLRMTIDKIKNRSSGVFKLSIIAPKASGKTTITKHISELLESQGIRHHIQDSDDWGKWITYCMYKTSSTTILELNEKMNQEQAIKYTHDFIRERMHLITESFFTTLANKFINNYCIEYPLEAEAMLRGDFKSLNAMIHTSFTVFTNQLLETFNSSAVNPKLFEYGIRDYYCQEHKDLFHISFFHLAQEDVKRFPSDILIRLRSIRDTNLDQIYRSIRAGQDEKLYLADLALKQFYGRATEHTVPELTPFDVMRLIGLVPVLRSNMSISLLPPKG